VKPHQCIESICLTPLLDRTAIAWRGLEIRVVISRKTNAIFGSRDYKEGVVKDVHFLFVIVSVVMRVPILNVYKAMRQIDQVLYVL
jgi:hypothetical protein